MIISDVFQKISRHRLLILSILLLIVARIYEVIVKVSYVTENIYQKFLGKNVLTNYEPNFSPPNLIRSFIIIVGTLLLIAYVRQHRASQAAPQRFNSQWLFNLAQWLGWIMAVICLVLFLVSPTWFAKATAEDYIVENLSALGLFVSCGLMVVVFVLQFLSRKQIKYKFIKLGVAAIMALVLFVSGMEEVSWFQRAIHYETPSFLASNSQHEANLHNLASNTSEEIYYFGSFVLLILIPFIADQSDLLTNIPGIKLFAPNVTVLFSCALLSAYNYNLWNRSTIQFAFFATLWILAFYSFKALREKPSFSVWRYFPILLLGLLVVTQAIFILRGQRFIQSWNVTEYREMIMPYGYVVWTLDVMRRAWLEFQQYRVAKSTSVPFPQVRVS